MMIFSPLFRRRVRLVVSCLLIVTGGAGAVHAVRASVAQRLYLETKYGFFRSLTWEKPPVTRSVEVGVRAYRADALYSKNYYFPTYAAKCALVDAMASTNSTDFSFHLTRAIYFSRLAVAMNPYEAEGRMIYALTLAESGRVDEAIAYWRDDVLEREFWNPENHNFMARLYLRSLKTADMMAAVAELPFVSDGDMRKKLQLLKKSLGHQ